MSKAKKARNAKLPQDRLNAKARNAAGAAATAGRSRVFADKGDKLAKASADPEIAEGLEEYNAKKAEISGAPNKPARLLQVAIYVDPNKIKGDPIEELQHWLEIDTSWPDYINSILVTG